MTPILGGGAGEAVLAVPHDLELPDAARARLQRQFARLQPAVGVVAPIHTLAPGSSVTTAAERAAMAPLDGCTTTTDLEVHGAVLLAAGVGHVVGAKSVRLEAATPPDDADADGLLVDPGAAAFDPGATDAAPAAPGDDMHPPFRWRPLVLFLAGTPDPAAARRAAALADSLLGLDVEPRLAVHDPLDGPLRIGPLLAEPALLDALRPDLVIALDADAVAWAQGSRATARSMVVAVLDEHLGDRIELVPWTLGSSQGRLRARLGDRADPRAVAALVNRLCSGPLPEPPADGPGRTAAPAPVLVPVPVPTPTRATAPRTLLVVDDADLGSEAGVAPLLAGLTDHLVASGWSLASPTETDATLAPDLVLVGTTASDGDPGDDGHVADRSIHVVEDHVAAAALAASASRGPLDRPLAIAASAQAAATLRAAGIDTIVVPVLPTRSVLDAVTDAFERRVHPAVPTIALLVGDRGDPAPDPVVVDAVGQALEQVAASYGELELVIVGDAEVDLPLPRTVPVRPGRADLLDPVRLVDWSLAVRLDGRVGGTDPDPAPERRTRSLTTVALAGVPVVLGGERTQGLGALADRSIAVARPAEPDDWTGAIGQLLDDDRRAVASQRSRRVATAIAGSQAATLVVARVLGWAEQQR